MKELLNKQKWGKDGNTRTTKRSRKDNT
jgi:hypothetical protein